MSKDNEYERAFFTSLRDYNSAKGQVGTLRVGLIAALLGNPSQRHVARYYPECART